MKKNYWYYIIFAISFAGFQFLEEGIREDYEGNNALFIYFLGVIPNFLPAIGMPCVLYAMIPELIQKPTSIWLTKKAYISVFLFTQLGLIVWEIQQIWAPNGTFDWNDILWTIIGGIVFLAFWRLISNAYVKST